MDNQNANGGFSPDPQNTPNPTPNPAPQNPAQDPKNAADAKNVVVQPLENLRTKSVIESPRELSADELAKANAYQAELLRKERAYRTKKKAERGAVYALLGLLAIVFVGIVIFVVVNLVLTNRGGGKNIGGDPNDPNARLDVVDGYECKTANCSRIEQLPDGRLLLRDENYFIYNLETREITQTAIENQDYISIKSFRWGDKILLVLDPTTEKSGLFSVTDNRLIVDYKYDEFFTSIDQGEIYDEMTWITSQYIVARTSSPSLYYLVDLVGGQYVLSASGRVFTHDGYYFGIEQDGERRVYQLGASSAFLVVSRGTKMYTREGVLITVSGENQIEYYLHNGERADEQSTPFIARLNEGDYMQIPSILESDSNFYKLPGN